MTTYSMKDVMMTIRGPNGAITFGGPTAFAEEGVSYEFAEDQTTMTTGAGPGAMHSLHASTAGRITLRLLKTSTQNALLSQMASADFQSAAVHGRNTITISDIARGDTTVGRNCAFKRHPNNSYAKVGNMIEWSWDVAELAPALGSGTPAVL